MLGMSECYGRGGQLLAWCGGEVGEGGGDMIEIPRQNDLEDGKRASGREGETSGRRGRPLPVLSLLPRCLGRIPWGHSPLDGSTASGESADWLKMMAVVRPGSGVL